MSYQWMATSVAGFAPQLAVAYVTNEYFSLPLQNLWVATDHRATRIPVFSAENRV